MHPDGLEQFEDDAVLGFAAAWAVVVDDFYDHVEHVYQPTTLLLLGLGGLLIAVADAFLPAGWAARTRTAVALRTE
ncbi:hypothetical protein ONA91_39405 [Micromonospora sp. DR5-3]|uniref:hypothetical protein n=1 Tax=unclassified Micromonospora TaxID=2617518 RepID=UPI00210351BF|nr:MULTISPECIES: hypothetical protein [unclassified Micromonospora]MCW3820516.1 hypothetical protein [Micromonospora sp. DR5-3]